MPCTTAVSVVRTIGIDTGKNTLHMIGLDEKGAIVLREKVSRNRIAALPVPRSLRSAMELPSRKGETLPLGLAWCRNRCRPVIARSLAASKRGNRYLRMLFVQGARAILLRPKSWAKHSFGSWLTAAARRLHRNVLTIALANKLARIALTVLVQERSYETRIEAAAA